MFWFLFACQKTEKTNDFVETTDTYQSSIDDTIEEDTAAGISQEDAPEEEEDSGRTIDTSSSEEDVLPQYDNDFGVWLWYIEGTGYTHESLAQKLAAENIHNIFIKVADGGFNCGNWPELCDTSIPETYSEYGITAWAWSYNYPGNEEAQAQALEIAYETGYAGYVMDIEIEFDGNSTALGSIMNAFYTKRNSVAPSTWELRVTTWGNPTDHNMDIALIDQYVDAHMPQTYLEVWGSTYMNNATYWVHYGDCEYIGLGATKPIHHIFSTEYGDITPTILEEAMMAGGPGSSVWRIPGGNVPLSIWDDWSDLDWNMSSFNEATCP